MTYTRKVTIEKITVLCQQCGCNDRYANGQCKTCSRRWNKKWAEANPEKIRALNLAWNTVNAKEISAKKAIKYAENKEHCKASSAAWVAANPEKVKAKNSAWKLRNADAINLRAAARRKANPEKVKLALATWAKANPESIRIKSHNRRNKLAASGRLSKGLIAKLFKLQKGKCPCCEQSLGDNYHLDHQMPLALGGSNSDENMQLLRSTCNQQKHAKHPVDFMQSRGFLL